MKNINLPIIFEKTPTQRGKFFSTSIYHLPKKKPSFLHYHDALELGICLCGHGECLTDKDKIHYSIGDAQLILPYQPHYNSADDDDTLWMFINIDVPKISSSHIILDPAYFIGLLQNSSASGIFSKKENPIINGLIMDIATLMQSDASSEKTLELITAKLATLLIVISQNQLQTVTSFEQTKKSQMVLPAIHCVSSSLKQGISPTPKQMADSCFMSESYFRKIFTAVIGESPKSYITRMKMQKAASLLATTSIPIIKIAEECGFEDNSTFYRGFIKIYGISPREYRNMIVKKE